jgi:hypothetical protein
MLLLDLVSIPSRRLPNFADKVHRPLVPGRPIRALAPHPLGFARARVCRRVVEPVISYSTPTPPARPKHDLIIVPQVTKKPQESGEDDASRMVFTKCSNKSSSVILVYAKPPSHEDNLVLVTHH